MIYYIGEDLVFSRFLQWERLQPELELDIETNVHKQWCQRKIALIQFGYAGDQYVLDWVRLGPENRAHIKRICEDGRLKMAHNAMFEAIVLLFHGIRLENVYDTMLMEMILYCGMIEEELEEDGETSTFYALRSLLYRYLNIILSKELQTSFEPGQEFTWEQIQYAAGDVTHLTKIKNQQIIQIGHQDLDFVAALENEAVLAYAEMTYEGMEIDRDAWLANIELAVPLVDQAKRALDAYLLQPPFAQKAQALNCISLQDRFDINWNSPKQKAQIFAEAFPQLEGVSKASILAHISRTTNYDEKVTWTKFLEKDYAEVEQYLVTYHRDWLINNQFLIPAGESTVNWNSPKQVLPLFQCVDPRLDSTSTDSLAHFPHHIGIDLAEYRDNLKLLSSYGQKFLDDHVEVDGKVRTSVSQIKSTGRISTAGPNMQQIPAKKSVGNRYRNAFTCPPHWKYVDSDYVSQELVIIAYISRDPVWTAALERGEDLHSICAELVFKKRWKEAADADCQYYKNKQKCNCKLHKMLRDTIKTINFGLAYGMSEFKLSASASISVPEAKALIKDYFTVFPRIGNTLNYLGCFGVRNGYIQTIAPFYRKRWFPFWKYSCHLAEYHIQGIKRDSTLGAIERASKNQPIQGTAADIAKLSIVMIRWALSDRNYRDRVKLVMQVHDQDTTICAEDFAEQWKVEMTDIMEKAAYFIIPNGLLKAETNITDRWSK